MNLTVKDVEKEHALDVEFDFSNIDQVYEGRLNVCRCGCAGEYYNPLVHGDKIKEGLSLLYGFNSRRKEILYYDFGDRIYFEIKTDTIDNPYEEEGDEYSDYLDREEHDMGWAFYLNK